MPALTNLKGTWTLGIEENHHIYDRRVRLGFCPACCVRAEICIDGWMRCPNRGPHNIEFRQRGDGWVEYRCFTPERRKMSLAGALYCAGSLCFLFGTLVKELWT